MMSEYLGSGVARGGCRVWRAGQVVGDGLDDGVDKRACAAVVPGVFAAVVGVPAGYGPEAAPVFGHWFDEGAVRTAVAVNVDQRSFRAVGAFVDAVHFGQGDVSAFQTDGECRVAGGTERASGGVVGHCGFPPVADGRFAYRTAARM